MSKYSHKGVRVGVPHLSAEEITYLLDVVFKDYADDPAPVASPIVGRTGELTVVQNAGETAISSGKLTYTKAGTPGWTDQQAYYNVLMDHNAGLILFARSKFSYDGRGPSIADDPSPPGASFTSGWYPNNTALRIWVGVSITVESGPASQYENFIMALRNQGAFFFRDNELAWADDQFTADTYPTFMIGYGETSEHAIFRLASLADNPTYPVPALGTRDLDLCSPGEGDGTSRIDSPSVNDTYVHTADFVLTFDLDTVPSAGNIRVDFRVQDEDNYWFVQIPSGATFKLFSKIDGHLTEEASAGGATGGQRVTVVINNETITGFLDDTQKWQISDASNSKTETQGRVNSLGTGGVISNLETRTLDGIANVGSSNFVGYGLATDVLPGPRSAGDPFTHEADCNFELMLGTLPSSNAITVSFREQDASNFWLVNLKSTGDYTLQEWIDGSPNGRASASGVLSGNERIVISCKDEEIKGFHGTTLDWTYPNAANFKTETSGEINSLGTGGQVSNLLAWPLTPASAPNTPDAAKINAAFNLMATP